MLRFSLNFNNPELNVIQILGVLMIYGSDNRTFRRTRETHLRLWRSAIYDSCILPIFTWQVRWLSVARNEFRRKQPKFLIPSSTAICSIHTIYIIYTGIINRTGNTFSHKKMWYEFIKKLCYKKIYLHSCKSSVIYPLWCKWYWKRTNNNKKKW